MSSESSALDDSPPQSNTNVSCPPDNHKPSGNKHSLDDTLLESIKTWEPYYLLDSVLSYRHRRPLKTVRESRSMRRLPADKGPEKPQVSNKEDYKLDDDYELDLLIEETKKPVTGEKNTSPTGKIGNG